MFYRGMELNSNISFKSRNSLIKDAGQVCRAVRKNFPYISHAKAAKEASYDIIKQENITDFLVRRDTLLKEYREDRRFLRTPVKFYKEILYTAIKEKLAACYELSALAELILRMNGITNCGKASLVSKSGKRLNHCVTYLQTTEKYDPKKLIIIDSWLQDCGFLPEMLTKYKNQYSKYFNKIHPKDTIHLEANGFFPLNRQDIEYFKEKYPQLILDKKKEPLFVKKSS